jgi:hypothetical protein
MNRKERLYNSLWLKIFLGDEHEEEDEKASSDEEESIISQVALIKRLNTRYLNQDYYKLYILADPSFIVQGREYQYLQCFITLYPAQHY